MCKVRDIILIDKYESEGVNIGRHSFVVIDDVADEICGMPYDMVCNVLSSFKNTHQRNHKLSYPGNFPISVNEINVQNGNKKEGYIKADQLYYFKKDKISYRVIGSMTENAFNALIDFINNSDFELVHIVDNIQQ